jgi:hypothetical protein
VVDLPSASRYVATECFGVMEMSVQVLSLRRTHNV